MSSHEDKYLSKLLFGFGSIIAAVMLILFVCFERMKHDEWYWWGMVIAILFCVGIYLIASACIHKMKSDMIRKQKIRHMQRSPDED
jgi:drug/metabolite transporter (DMT)-like permease